MGRQPHDWNPIRCETPRRGGVLMRTETELMNLKKNELVEIAESLNADTSGTKAQLTKRILTFDVQPHIESEQEHDELTASKIEEKSDIEAKDDEAIAENTP